MHALKTAISCGIGMLCLLFTSAAFAAGPEAPTSTIAGLPSPVFWTGLVFGLLGFFLGSIPPNRGEMGADEFDGRGAFVWGIGLSTLSGSLLNWYLGGDAITSVVIGALAMLLIFWRVMSTAGARKPTRIELVPGINRPSGESARQRTKNALRMYNGAGFRKGTYHASRSNKEYHFDNYGMSAAVSKTLADSLRRAHSSQFDILVLLVEGVPDKPGELAVVVVRGAEQLQQIRLDATNLNINGLPAIKLSSIRACVGYAWR